MICPVCKKETPLKHKKKFRCVICKALLLKPKKKFKCEFCKQTFETDLYDKSLVNNKRFCSVNCRVKNHQHKKRTPEELLRTKLVSKLSTLSLEQLGELLNESKS